jgi:PAS domain S-box-containing protein
LDETSKVDEQLQDALNSMRAVVWSATLPDIELTYLSPSAKHLFGCEIENAYDNDRMWTKNIHPDDIPIFLEGTQNAITEGDALIEHRILGSKKEVYWVQNQLKVNFEHDGTPVKLNGIMIEITNLKKSEDRMKQSKERLKSILKVAPTGIGVVSNRTLTEVNPFMCKMTGYSRNELIGSSSRILYPSQEEYEYVGLEKYSQIQKNGIGTVETRWKKKDGKIIDILMYSTPIDKSNLAKGVTFTALDITKRKESEDKLRKSEKFLSKIFDVLPVGLWIADKNGKIISTNDAGKKIWGAKPRVGVEEYGIFNARYYPSMKELKPDDWALLHTIKERATIEDELLEIDTFDGKKKIILNYAAPVIDDNEDILGAIVVNNDVTEKTKVDRELKDHANFLNTLLDTIPDPIYYKDENCIYTGCNQAFAQKILGIPKKDIIGKTLHELAQQTRDNEQEKRIPDDLLQIYNKMDAELIKNGMLQSYEVEVRIANGNINSYINSRAAIYNSGGDITGIVGAMLDITERKEAESEIINAKIEAEAASRTKSEFLTTISHELRTPLNAIIGYSDMLIEEDFGKINDKQKRFSQHIHNSGKHLLELINDILDISKIESGKLELLYEDFILKDLMENVENIVKPLAIKKRIELCFPTDYNRMSIKADKIKFKQILYNIMNNAVKFTPENGSIVVSTELNGNYLEVSVKDNGIGISEESQKHLFTPFYQADSSCSREYQGTGLGLSLVRKLANLHGGKVTVESVLGKGSTFTITIPINPENN